MDSDVSASLLALGFAIAIVASSCSPAPTTTPATSSGPAAFHGGASSVDELLDQFLLALAARDGKRLDQLRVDEAEYRSIILPGGGKAGEPMRQFPQRKSAYFWRLHSTKSFYATQSLLGDFGGRVLTRRATDFSRGIEHYAGFTAYRRATLTLVDERGQELELHTGSIAEHGGRYKFISYFGD
jgi:hypothetical protein